MVGSFASPPQSRPHAPHLTRSSRSALIVGMSSGGTRSKVGISPRLRPFCPTELAPQRLCSTAVCNVEPKRMGLARRP